MSAQLKPITVFEDNVRPALLMLDVYKILKTDSGPVDTHELLAALRSAVSIDDEEDLLFFQSELFLGIIRERADMSKARFKPRILTSLLRQAVVCAATALETYLPSMLRYHLPEVIKLTGRDFLSGKQTAVEWLKDVSFSVPDVMDIWGLPAPDMAYRLSDKIFGKCNFSYLSSMKGIEVVGNMLQIDDPADAVSQHLGREVADIRKSIKSIITRRNDIVHRADRAQDDPVGDQQEITHEWAKHGVDTIDCTCRALSTLVDDRIEEIRSSSEQVGHQEEQVARQGDSEADTT